MAGLEPSWNGDVSLATLQQAPVFPELYYPIWLYSGSSVGFNGTEYFVAKGSPTASGSLTSANNLFTIPTSWPANLQFAFEATLGLGAATSCSAQLYDVTAGGNVSASTKITSSTGTMTVIRSGKFTLTPGHTYTIYCQASSSAYITDASLIVFPSSPLTSPSVSAISLANPSGNTLKESYVPLWVYSVGTVQTTTTTAGNACAAKGTTTAQPNSNTASKLYTLSTNWSPSQKFALEASIYVVNSAYTANAQLWDMTSNVSVGSIISTPNTTATVIRSSSFTLTPGHSYGVTLWINTAGFNAFLTKAHLVALAQ